VNRESFSFEGLEPIEDRIRRLSPDAAYLVIQDRTIPRKDETLARFDLNEASALPYIEDEPSEEPLEDLVEDDDGPADPYDEEEEEDDDAPTWDPPSSRQRASLSRELILRAACLWIRDVAVRNTVGEEYCRFRVKVYGPKGARMLDSAQFVCRNHDADLHLPLLADKDLPRIPAPTFEQAATAGGAKGIKALGDYYAQWGQIVLGSVGQLQGVNNAMLNRLHRQLRQARDQVDQLVAAILENRYKELELAEERRADERAGDARTELAREALNQLGDAAKAFLTARGVTPELADVLGVIGTSPELVSTLSDPDVRALMQDPANLKSLAQMLKAAAAQARAAQQAQAQAQQPGGGTTPPPGPNPTTNPTQPAAG